MSDNSVLNSRTFWPHRYVVIKDGVLILETDSLEDATKNPQANAYEQTGYRVWTKVAGGKEKP